MNVWIPGLIVVAVGLAAGLWFAFAGSRGRDEAAAGSAPTPPGPTAPAVVSPAVARRSGLVGFLFGVGTCAVVGGLVYWATQGSKPREEMGSGAMAPAGVAARAPGTGAPGNPDEAHEAGAEVTPEVAAELAALRARVAAAPTDLDARRQLTVALLNASLLMEAFEQAKELQKVAPDDPDGLFVEGVVRLAMGQWPLTVELMNSVLEQHPDHLLAALAKGQAQASLGQTGLAIATLKQGLAAAGGRFPPIEELLAQLETDSGAGMPGADAAPPGVAAPPPAPAESANAAAPESYRVHIELAPGTAAPRGVSGATATLFVALRGDTPGPPAAVKRIVDPTFPLDLTLSAADSMMGQPLPQKGRLSVSLDGDGNASTQEPGDLAAAVEAFAGTPVHLRLTAAGD